MILNQNETLEKFVVASCEARVLVCRPLTRASRLAPRAFTLTELLVVITIIAIISSLLTVAVANAMRRAKQAAITLELQQLGSAIEDFNNTYSAYPPNSMNPGGRNLMREDIASIVASDVTRMFKKAFPRAASSELAILGAVVGIRPSGNSPVTSSELIGGMTASESIVFWLGGFSSDPQFPLSGPGGPSFLDDGSGDRLEERNWGFEFDLGKLGPRNDDGLFDEAATQPGRFIRYEFPVNSNIFRRINFWRYTPGESDVEVAYFDVSRNKPAEYDVDMTGNVIRGNLYALKKLREGTAAINDVRDDIRFVNEGKFQILHCGIDDAWGDFSIFDTDKHAASTTLYPDGPFIGDIADTLTHFTTGAMSEEQE